MLSVRVLGPWVLCLSNIVSPIYAQSVSLDESKKPAPLQTKPVATPRHDRVAAPIAVATPIEYPEGAQGEHDVVLELMISKDGSVTTATAVSGEQPFASARRILCPDLEIFSSHSVRSTDCCKDPIPSEIQATNRHH